MNTLIKISGSRTMWTNAFVVYLVREYVSQEVLFVGCCRFSKLLEMPDCKLPATTVVSLETVSQHGTIGQAKSEQSKIIRSFGLQKTMNAVSYPRVRCVNTGEIWSSAYRAAQAHKIDLAALTRHLQGKSGHKTIKGKKYERIC